MIIRLLRSLLLTPPFWLAMLVLPFGAPAAAAQPCHHAQARDAVVHASVHMAVHAEHAPSLHEHGHGGHDAGHDRGHCTSCPACCAGAAPAPAQPAAPPGVGPAFVAIPFRAGHLPSVDPSLPERPPRPAFA